MTIFVLNFLRELLNIFTKKEGVTILVQKIENLDSFMRTKYISSWTN